jgi:hypothetical protein
VTSLDGAVVAVFGHAPDTTAELALALAELGATVLVCPIWSPWFDPPYEKDLLAIVEPVTARPGQIHFLAGLDGRPFSDLPSDPPGVRRFVSWVRRAFGHLDAVVLGFHTVLGLTAGDTLAAALRRTGGEVIAIEGDADSADQIVRTCAEVGDRRARPTVMRHSAGRKRKPSDRLGPVGRVRVQAGGGDYDHGGCAVVTARSLDAAGPFSEIDRVGWHLRCVTPLNELGVDGVIVSHDNGIAAVEVVPSRSRVVALRVGTLTDSFDTDEPYAPAGEWRPGNRDLVIGDPWVVLVEGGGLRVRLDAQPEWHIDHAMLDGEMTGFRMWSDAAPDLARRGVKGVVNS